MLKIVLLFLFCAIAGYGINGYPNNTIIIPPQEIKATAKVVIPTTNLNDTTLSPHHAETVAPQTVPSNNGASNVTVAEPSTKPTISNTNIQSAEEASISAPMNKSLPMAATNSTKVVTNNISNGSPTTTESSVTTASTVINASPVTTTEAPVVPVPEPKAGKWILTKNNQSCIIVNVALQFHVAYMNKSSNITTYKVFNLPNSANETTVTGDCGKLEQNIIVSWTNTQNVTNNVNLHFVKNDTKHSYSLHHMEIVLLNPNNTVILANNTLSIATNLDNSYRCMKRQNYTLTQSGTNGTMGYFLLSDLQFQAFKTDNTKEFGTVEDCKLDTPDIVPIAVGCALAGLVLIMLIAYLIGLKRRQAAGGYASM